MKNIIKKIFAVIRRTILNTYRWLMCEQDFPDYRDFEYDTQCALKKYALSRDAYQEVLRGNVFVGDIDTTVDTAVEMLGLFPAWSDTIHSLRHTAVECLMYVWKAVNCDECVSGTLVALHRYTLGEVTKLQLKLKLAELRRYLNDDGYTDSPEFLFAQAVYDTSRHIMDFNKNAPIICYYLRRAAIIWAEARERDNYGCWLYEYDNARKVQLKLIRFIGNPF